MTAIEAEHKNGTNCKSKEVLSDLFLLGVGHGSLTKTQNGRHLVCSLQILQSSASIKKTLQILSSSRQIPDRDRRRPYNTPLNTLQWSRMERER